MYENDYDYTRFQSSSCTSHFTFHTLKRVEETGELAYEYDRALLRAARDLTQVAPSPFQNPRKAARARRRDPEYREQYILIVSNRESLFWLSFGYLLVCGARRGARE